MLEGPKEYVNARWIHVKSTWIPTWHQMDHVFMVTWTKFKNYLCDIGLAQNRKTMALRALTSIDLLYLIIELHWISIWFKARLHMTSHYTWGSVTTLHDFGRCVGTTAFGHLFIWALTISWSRLLARVWSGPLAVGSPPSLPHETRHLTFFYWNKQHNPWPLVWMKNQVSCPALPFPFWGCPRPPLGCAA